MRQYLRPGIVPVNPGIKTRASGSHPGAEEFLSVGSLDRSTQDLAALLYPGAVADLSEGLETPVQLFYLLTVLTILVAGAFLVVRQVLVRNQLEETIKVLGERKRKGEATAEDYFELGIILVRKKLYTQVAYLSCDRVLSVG